MQYDIGNSTAKITLVKATGDTIVVVAEYTGSNLPTGDELQCIIAKHAADMVCVDESIDFATTEKRARKFVIPVEWHEVPSRPSGSARLTTPYRSRRPEQLAGSYG